MAESEAKVTPHQNERGRIQCGCFTAGLGLLALALSLGFWIEQRHFVSKALPTEGIVKQVWEPSDPQRGHSLVAYEVDGKAFELDHQHDWSGVTTHGGERVTVLYPAQRPDRGRVEGSSDRWEMVVTFGIVAAVTFSISAFCFVAPVLFPHRPEESARPA
jgi:hypothetical protein